MTENENEKYNEPRNFADWAENAVVSLCDECVVTHRSIAILFRKFNFNLDVYTNNNDAAKMAHQLVCMYAIVTELKEIVDNSYQKIITHENLHEQQVKMTQDLLKENYKLEKQIKKLTKGKK